LKFYVFGLLLLIIQTTVIEKFFNFNCIVWDSLSIFVILFSLHKPPKETYKLTLFISILEDIFSYSYFINLFSKMFIAFLSQKFHEKFFISSLWIKGIIVLFLSCVDIFFKIIYSYLITGIFHLCFGYIIYLMLNFIIFYFFYLINEDKKI